MKSNRLTGSKIRWLPHKCGKWDPTPHKLLKAEGRAETCGWNSLQITVSDALMAPSGLDARPGMVTGACRHFSCTKTFLPLILECERLFCAQTCVFTLLTGFQLFDFQVMGELWKRNQTGLRRSIPPTCALPVSLPPPRQGCRGTGHHRSCGTVRAWPSQITSHRLSQKYTILAIYML